MTKRNVVSKQIRDLLTQRSAEFNILLDDVAITHLAFSREYTAAVEAKQVAQQDAERAKYIVDRAIQEKKSIIIKAQGEAQAAQLIGNVSSNCSAIMFETLIIFLFKIYRRFRKILPSSNLERLRHPKKSLPPSQTPPIRYT